MRHALTLPVSEQLEQALIPSHTFHPRGGKQPCCQYSNVQVQRAASRQAYSRARPCFDARHVALLPLCSFLHTRQARHAPRLDRAIGCSHCLC